MAPDRKIPGYSTTIGALFTAIGWIGVTYIYSYYISHFANYSVFYGTLANIVILMVWVYFLSYLFVIGMAMNYHEDLERTTEISVKDIVEAKEKLEESTEVEESTEAKKE